MLIFSVQMPLFTALVIGMEQKTKKKKQKTEIYVRNINLLSIDFKFAAFYFALSIVHCQMAQTLAQERKPNVKPFKLIKVAMVKDPQQSSSLIAHA